MLCDREKTESGRDLKLKKKSRNLGSRFCSDAGVTQLTSGQQLGAKREDTNKL